MGADRSHYLLPIEEVAFSSTFAGILSKSASPQDGIADKPVRYSSMTFNPAAKSLARAM
jgi:hypothetical protein